MSHFLYGCFNFFWCNCSAVQRCSESNLSRHSDDLCQSFTKVFVIWIIIYNHQFKLNGTTLMVIARYPYQPLTKETFSRPEICVNILDIGRTEYALSCQKQWSMTTTVMHWENLLMVSQKTRIMECGVFRMGEPVSTTINVPF